MFLSMQGRTYTKLVLNAEDDIYWNGTFIFWPQREGTGAPTPTAIPTPSTSSDKDCGSSKSDRSSKLAGNSPSLSNDTGSQNVSLATATASVKSALAVARASEYYSTRNKHYKKLVAMNRVRLRKHNK